MPVHYNSPLSVLNTGEEALFVCTEEIHFFSYTSGGSGSTGYWTMNPALHPNLNTVVVCQLGSREGAPVIELYKAKYNGSIVQSNGTYEVLLNNVQHVGYTTLGWVAFTGNRNPVHYFP